MTKDGYLLMKRLSTWTDIRTGGNYRDNVSLNMKFLSLD